MKACSCSSDLDDSWVGPGAGASAQCRTEADSAAVSYTAFWIPLAKRRSGAAGAASGVLLSVEVLAVAYGTGKAVVWDDTLADWKRHACAVAGRNFTRDEWRFFLPDRSYQAACPTLPRRIS